jgi:hypothetical protein
MISKDLSAHNVYIALLADTGILGLAWFICFVAASFFAALGINDPRTRNAAVGTLFSYAVMGFFDARGLNSGNPFSLYFEMCAFFALRHASLQHVLGPSGAIRIPAGNEQDAISGSGRNMNRGNPAFEQH